MPFSDHLGSHHQENCRPRDVHLILESCASAPEGMKTETTKGQY